MDLINIIFIILLSLVFYFFFMRANNKKQDMFIKNLKKGDCVIMTSGLCGYFYNYKDGKITIETDERGHKLTFLESSLWLEGTKKLNSNNASDNKV